MLSTFNRIQHKEVQFYSETPQQIVQCPQKEAEKDTSSDKRNVA